MAVAMIANDRERDMRRPLLGHVVRLWTRYTPTDLWVKGPNGGALARRAWPWILVPLIAAMLTGDASAQTTRVSLTSSGLEGNLDSIAEGISGDGQVVVFWGCYATNLVPGDTNDVADIFVHDRGTGETTRVSVDSVGVQANGESLFPSISADGRYIAFLSTATNLVPGDTNVGMDVFVHDRQTKQTVRVNVDSSGAQANGNSCCNTPVLSGDGRFVAFSTNADNLVPNDTNSLSDVFVHDQLTGETTRVSVSSSGKQGNQESGYPAISADGRYVAFASNATNMVPGDTNNFSDIFLHDRQTGITTRESVDSMGADANDYSLAPSISDDGNLIAFMSAARDLVSGDTNHALDIFVRDRAKAQTIRVSVNSAGVQGDANSNFPHISGDGRFVAFNSDATNLASGDTNDALDVFLRDLETKTTHRVSLSSTGEQASVDCGGTATSRDGRYVAFRSVADNLVTGDTNGVFDAFVRDTCEARWASYGTGWPGTQGIPTLVTSGDPVLCSTISISIGNSLGVTTQAVLFLGFDDAALSTAWDGMLLVLPLLTLPMPLPASGIALPATLPCDDSFCGLRVYLQTLEFDPGASSGVSFTPGLLLVLG